MSQFCDIGPLRVNTDLLAYKYSMFHHPSIHIHNLGRGMKCNNTQLRFGVSTNTQPYPQSLSRIGTCNKVKFQMKPVPYSLRSLIPTYSGHLGYHSHRPLMAETSSQKSVYWFLAFPPYQPASSPGNLTALITYTSLHYTLAYQLLVAFFFFFFKLTKLR